ncbi:MAG: hypothetical protein CL908_08395 [Deltaproteobacteria bacterium]|nr:hypothetical protein [Deltaproteobacteria bacterium]
MLPRPSGFASFPLVLGAALLTSSLAAISPATAAAQLIAERITAENFASHRVGGPDSDAGIGDWFLSNGTLCAAISDPGHESAIVPRGGVLIDLGHCGASDDQWAVLQPMLNLSQKQVVPVSEIEAGGAPGQVWLRTRAVFDGVELRTTYAVDDATPTALSIAIRARRIEDGDRLFAIGSILLHPSGQTSAFSLLRSDPERSIGFAYPSSDRNSLSSLLNALVSSDLTVLVGGDEMPPISYGVERISTTLTEDGKPAPLASFSVSGSHFTFVNTLTRPPWFGEADGTPGPLQLMQLPFMDVAPETLLTSEMRIWLGRRADVASITDQLFADSPRVEGRVDDPEARIHIDMASGAPFTQIRPDSDGRFAARLPAGAYRARALAPAEREATVEFEVAAGRPLQELPPLSLGPPGWIDLPSDFIGRLSFLAEDGSGAARFGDRLLGFRIGDEDVPGGLEAPFVNLAASPIDPRRVPVGPGRYRVVAVRGPEYAASETTIEVHRGEGTPLELAPLRRVAETAGWISADLHVHSGESFDSSLPLPRQVVAFAASGAEILVATEHDRIFDPRPAIRETGLADQLVGMTGVEVTSSYEGGDSPHATGHLNAFPMTPVPGAYRAGAPDLEGRRLRDALSDIHALDPAPFVQMNHPRPKLEEGEGDTYFSHLGVAGEPFDPTLTLDQMPNAVLIEKSPVHGGRDLDYHGVELMNAESMIRYRRTRADWLSLLLQGERIVATANSDSHRLGRIVGLPRTYVEVADDALAAFDPDLFMKSLRAGRAYGTTGPIITARLDAAAIGEVHSGRMATLHVTVDAAPWVPVAEWRAFVGGELVHRAPIEAGGRAELPLFFEKDSFVTVEVEGPAEGIYRDALPDFTPFAFTNPIFVDVDGNGRYDAPGLPERLPVTIRDPDRPD